MTRRRAAILAVAAALIGAGLPLQARDPKADYALIFVTVFGPDDRAVPGIKVKVRLAEKKKSRWEQVSDRRGEMGFRVPVGTADYVVWVDLKDRQLSEKTAVKVHIVSNERQDAFLHLTGEQLKGILKK